MSFKTKFMSKVAQSPFGKMLSNHEGVAAIEFALVAPIMIFFYFGMTEITMAISADRKVAHTASVVGDLATQVTEINKAELESILTAALIVVDADTNTSSKLGVELISYELDGSNSVVEVGYAKMGPISGTAFDTAKVKDMMTTTSGAVVARVNFEYQPVTMSYVQKMTLSETFILKPRKSASVIFDEGGTSTFSCTVSGMTPSC